MLASVCYFGTYESDYDRNRIVKDALRAEGIRVLECHEPLLEARRDKTGAFGRDLVGLAARGTRAYARLAARYLAMPDHDAVVVGYLGHLDVLVAAALARLRDKPLIFDAFISLSDTLVEDRGLFARGSIPAGLVAGLDRLACALSDVVLLDTEAHARFFVDALGAPAGRTLRVLVGADPDVFHPGPPARAPEAFTVLFYGKLAPLHGLRTIVEAATRLDDDPGIRFLVVGEGQLDAELDRWLAELGPTNVERRRWMEGEALRDAIAGAGVALGIFGPSGKAARVIPNKVYQCMAVGAPIVTADTPGARELLADGEHALLVPAGDPDALAAAIRRLRDDPALAARLSENARRRFEAEATVEAIGRRLVADLDRALTARRPYRRSGGSASARPSATTGARRRSRRS